MASAAFSWGVRNGQRKVRNGWTSIGAAVPGVSTTAMGCAHDAACTVAAPSASDVFLDVQYSVTTAARAWRFVSLSFAGI